MHLYIILCSDKTYFTGLTTDLAKRFFQHESGRFKKCYTYNRRPLKLVYARAFSDFDTAIKRHVQVKRWSQAKKEALVHEYQAALPGFSKKKF